MCVAGCLRKCSESGVQNRQELSLVGSRVQSVEKVLANHSRRQHSLARQSTHGWPTRSWRLAEKSRHPRECAPMAKHGELLAVASHSAHLTEL